jgi:hypothetical protein
MFTPLFAIVLLAIHENSRIQCISSSSEGPNAGTVSIFFECRKLIRRLVAEPELTLPEVTATNGSSARGGSRRHWRAECLFKGSHRR